MKTIVVCPLLFTQPNYGPTICKLPDWGIFLLHCLVVSILPKGLHGEVLSMIGKECSCDLLSASRKIIKFSS